MFLRGDLQKRKTARDGSRAGGATVDPAGYMDELVQIVTIATTVPDCWPESAPPAAISVPPVADVEPPAAMSVPVPPDDAESPAEPPPAVSVPLPPDAPPALISVPVPPDALFAAVSVPAPPLAEVLLSEAPVDVLPPAEAEDPPDAPVEPDFSAPAAVS